MELAKNLLKLSRKKKMSIASLAKKSGVKQPTLHGWTTGRSVQNIDDLKKVCEVLEVGLHTLLFGIPDPYETNQKLIEEIFKGDITVTIHKIVKND
ncbi:helix-turn-helix domain-containing protein [Peredibacter sp. HCB2-198]|uniref:helix-turn-helix domain-containing protein n=1 Tax=Peredibacter sp. HCB2-198 TaxID=3383025 RepID=UPI0038B6118F